jgi:hypothetical protein
MARMVTLTVRVSDMISTRLLIWTIWQLVGEMRVAGPHTAIYADKLEEALDRYVRSFAKNEDGR